MHKESNVHDPTAYNMYTSFGCANDVISLTCPINRTIVITKAQWSKYYLECSDCCPPNPAYDCSVDMETAEPDFFGYIKFQCDGMTSCDLEYASYLVNECELEYTADYEQVFYDCIPFDETGLVAFSAMLSRNYWLLNQLEIVPFDLILSNFGGYYSSETFTFTCPVNGVYMFSITINQRDNNFIRTILFRNDIALNHVRADDDSIYDSSSSILITECNSGDQVFVGVDVGGLFDGDVTKCHFTGYLLHTI